MEIPLDVLKLVATYLVKLKMKLLDWIYKDELHWNALSANPNAIQLLELVLQQDPEMIDWNWLALNRNYVECNTFIRSKPSQN